MKRETELQKLGNIVRKYRIDKGLTQFELAEKAGVDRNYIGMLERGERNASFLTLLKISFGLGIPLWKLFKLYKNE